LTKLTEKDFIDLQNLVDNAITEATYAGFTQAKEAMQMESRHEALRGKIRSEFLSRLRNWNEP
jgi:hypothetical protein